MEFLRKIINKVKYFRKSEDVRYQELTPEEKIRKCLQPYQRCLYKLQDIILWESTSQSLLTLLATNLLFWLVSLHQFRFYFLLFSVALLYVTHEAWSQHIWPEISVKPNGEETHKNGEHDYDHQERLGEPEISHYVSSFCVSVSELISRMKSLRETQPLVFGGIMSSFFLTLVAVGRVMSGLCLLYILVMSALLLPGLFIHVVPPEYKEKMYNIYTVLHSLMNPSESSVDVDEYLPETSRENMELFAEAVEFNTDTNGSSSDSVSADLCLMSRAMPSHEETSMDAYDSLSLDPSAALRADTSSDDEASSSEFSLQFQPTHFNGKASTVDDTSSSAIGQSTNLIGQSASSIIGQSASSIISQGADLIASAVTSTVAQSLVGLAARPAKPPARADSSDDSEFEIIETEDVS